MAKVLIIDPLYSDDNDAYRAAVENCCPNHIAIITDFPTVDAAAVRGTDAKQFDLVIVRPDAAKIVGSSVCIGDRAFLAPFVAENMPIISVYGATPGSFGSAGLQHDAERVAYGCGNAGRALTIKGMSNRNMGSLIADEIDNLTRRRMAPSMASAHQQGIVRLFR